MSLITIILIVAVERLYDKFWKEYLKELSDLEIGYGYNNKRINWLKKTMELLYYLNNTWPDPNELAAISELILE